MVTNCCCAEASVGASSASETAVAAQALRESPKCSMVGSSLFLNLARACHYARSGATCRRLQLLRLFSQGNIRYMFLVWFPPGPGRVANDVRRGAGTDSGRPAGPERRVAQGGPVSGRFPR